MWPWLTGGVAGLPGISAKATKRRLLDNISPGLIIGILHYHNPLPSNNEFKINCKLRTEFFSLLKETNLGVAQALLEPLKDTILRQTDRQTDRQTVSQTDRQTHS